MTHIKTYSSAMKFASLPSVAILLWLAALSGKATATTVAAEATATNAIVQSTSPETPDAPATPAPSPTTEVAEATMTTNSAAASAEGSKPTVENLIYKIANSDRTPHEKATELFAMFSKLDPQGQRKVALAAVKQIDDADYTLLRKNLLDPKLDRRVLSVLMTDTLKRKNSIKLPALLGLARLDTHPLRDEARELLRAFLQKDYGTDWAKWEQAVETWLVSNPN